MLNLMIIYIYNLNVKYADYNYWKQMSTSTAILHTKSIISMVMVNAILEIASTLSLVKKKIAT